MVEDDDIYLIRENNGLPEIAHLDNNADANEGMHERKDLADESIRLGIDGNGFVRIEPNEDIDITNDITKRSTSGDDFIRLSRSQIYLPVIANEKRGDKWKLRGGKRALFVRHRRVPGTFIRLSRNLADVESSRPNKRGMMWKFRAGKRSHWVMPVPPEETSYYFRARK